jgi:hypothetical protein
MSALRDVRLLIARHLDLPTEVRASILNVLNVLDNALDAEGWQEGPDVNNALRALDAAILGMEMTEEEDDEEELIDIDDIEVLDESEDEDDEEDGFGFNA